MKKVTLLPGDGIGPEITDAVVHIFLAAGVPIEWDRVDCGLVSFKECGELLPKRVFESLGETMVALKGPTTTPSGGGHRSINVALRQQENLYANVRPIKSYEGVDCLFEDLDLIIVRENSEDLYKGVEYQVSPDVAHGIKIITKDASIKIGKHAFELARKHNRKKVTVVHKANIMKLTDGLFLKSVSDVAKDYPEIEFNDVIVDACCMQLVRFPKTFDVIVTENLYGDILSDLGSGLIGGLGLASGANIGDNKAVFEAVHGSAPDIAGQNIANPTALLGSALTMLKYLEMDVYEEKISKALTKCLKDPNTRTADLGGKLGTKEFAAAISAELNS